MPERRCFPSRRSCWRLPAALAQAKRPWPQNWRRCWVASTFPLDNYYRDLSHLAPAERVRENFDDPALIESSLLAAHVAALAQGQPIERPLYNFATHTRIQEQTETVPAKPFLLVEGLFALCYAELLPLYQLRVYVDTPDDVCFARRLKRDVDERGRTPESVYAQYDATVRPSSLQFVRPSAAHADLTVDGSGALDWKVERVLTEMRRRSLLMGFPD